MRQGFVEEAGMKMLRNTPRRVRIIVLLCSVLLLFILFEIGIRFLPPNGMTYTSVDTASGVVGYSVSSTDAKTVAYWYRYTNNAKQLAGFLGRRCSAPAMYVSKTNTFTFTLYGIPIESFSGEDANVCYQYVQSAGGLPNIFTQYWISSNPETYFAPK